MTITTDTWTASGSFVNIPGHSREIYYPTDPRFDVELEPFNGYDDGRLHADRLRFVVSIYERVTYDAENDEWIDSTRVYSRRFKTESAARCGLLAAAIKCAELIEEAKSLDTAEGRDEMHDLDL